MAKFISCAHSTGCSRCTKNLELAILLSISRHLPDPLYCADLIRYLRILLRRNKVFFTPSMLWSQGPNWCSREGKAQTPVNIDFTLLLWVLGSAVLGNWWSLTSNWHHFHNISVCIDCLAPTRCADLWPFVVFQLLILSRQLSLSQRFIYACYSCTLQAF